MKLDFKAMALTRAAIDTLGQLYAHGPTWDGNIVSKQGRAELLMAGLAFHEHGYASLTPEGVRVAAEWDIRDLIAREQRSGVKCGWLGKRRAS